MSSQQCVATCSGYSSLRSECIANPCYADNLCQFIDPSITDCAAWCCQSRRGLVFLMILLLCAGVFFLMAAYYVKRLHEANVQAGAVGKDGKTIQVVQEAPKHSKRLRAIMTSMGTGTLAPVASS